MDPSSEFRIEVVNCRYKDANLGFSCNVEGSIGRSIVCVCEFFFLFIFLVLSWLFYYYVIVIISIT